MTEIKQTDTARITEALNPPLGEINKKHTVTKFLAGMAVGLVRQLFMEARRHAMLSVVSAQIIHFNYLLAGFSALARLFPGRISPLVIPHNDESRCEYKTQRG